jgi:DNA-binding transcriptional regulator YdaS (Cro superfamily)
MGGKDGRPDAVREQSAKILRAAQERAGGREALAGLLGVAPHLVGEWIAKIADAPDEIVNRAIDLLIPPPR